MNKFCKRMIPQKNVNSHSLIEEKKDLYVNVQKDFVNKRVLITAGPSREYIDEIRFITNNSSGIMGIELAKEAKKRGADVLLINGKSIIDPPKSLKVINVESTRDFVNAITCELTSKNYDIFICAAALNDYEPSNRFRGKINSDNMPDFEIILKLAPKGINKARIVDENVFIIAFKAETNVSNDELISRAYSRLKKSRIDMIVANNVGRRDIGFQSKYNEVFIIDKEKNILHICKNTKNYIASKILDLAIKRLK